VTTDVPVVYTPWKAQARVHTSKARFRVVMAGRQSGKTMTGIAEICNFAMSHPGAILWWVAPSYKVKDRAWRGILDFLPKQVIGKKNETESRVALGNNSIIWVKSADAEEALVSESLDGVVCDEAGQWKENVWIRGIGPMLTARPNAWALFIGTPRGKNWFYHLWLRGKNNEPDWASFHWASAESPYVSREYIEEMRRTTPGETFMQEYEANPLDNALSAFRNFRNCIGGYGLADRFMCLGVDLARKLDFTVQIAMNSKRQVTSFDRYQNDWAVQKQKIVATAFGLGSRVVMDATGVGDVFIQQVRESGVQAEGYIFTNESKQVLIDNLRVAFENGTITIPDEPVLINELAAYEITQNDKTGRYYYSAPDGQHDDAVVALALALWGQRGTPIWSNPVAGDDNYLSRGRSSANNYLRRSA